MTRSQGTYYILSGKAQRFLHRHFDQFAGYISGKAQRFLHRHFDAFAEYMTAERLRDFCTNTLTSSQGTYTAERLRVSAGT